MKKLSFVVFCCVFFLITGQAQPWAPMNMSGFPFSTQFLTTPAEATAIAYDQNYVYIGTLNRGIWRSLKGVNGSGWTNINGNLPAYGYSNGAIYPTIKDIIISGTKIYAALPGIHDATSNTVTAQGGVYVTSNGGNTWTQQVSGLSFSPLGNFYDVAALSRTETNLIVAGCNGKVYSCPGSSSTWTVRSGNLGKINKIINAARTTGVLLTHNNVIVATNNGVYAQNTGTTSGVWGAGSFSLVGTLTGNIVSIVPVKKRYYNDTYSAYAVKQVAGTQSSPLLSEVFRLNRISGVWQSLGDPFYSGGGTAGELLASNNKGRIYLTEDTDNMNICCTGMRYNSVSSTDWCTFPSNGLPNNPYNFFTNVVEMDIISQILYRGTLTNGIYYSNDTQSSCSTEPSERLSALEEEIKGSNLHPNPASTQLTLSNLSEMGIIHKIEVLNMNGQSIQQEVIEGERAEIEINISQLPQGIYILRVDTENGQKVEKFIKE